MKKIIRLLTVCLTSVIATSCLHRADSLRMLEVRADYDGKNKEEASELKLGDDHALREANVAVPVRTMPKTAQIWIFPHETPSKEYFWGGWISVVVEGDRWEIERPGALAPRKPVSPSPLPIDLKGKKQKKAGT
jgi:Type IV conjugative transfer system lipoprotein (TraV)